MATRKEAARGRRRLGRGLDSLISAPVAVEPPPAAADPAPAQQAVDGGLVHLALADLRPNPRQPRQRFDETALEALAASIKAAGLMQPVVVRPGTDGRYELIAGERRWRAAQRLGLETIPAVVREVDDGTAAELALIENLQREDLNPIERAEAFERLAGEFGLTHQQIADRVGLDRSSVTNLLRLNDLDDATKELVRAKRLGLGHARALLGIANKERRTKLAAKAARDGWSVRELERRARAEPVDSMPGRTPTSKADPLAHAHVDDLERRLGESLGTKVSIVTGRKKGTGRIVVEFYSLDQFEGLMDRIGFATDA